ncbi:MAG: tetratricopeptide repeat protein [Desulfobulbaceae bacterium]|nr:tetratricopeptide repeat protein [Desulfobulbaceae bacterium]
MKELTLSGSLWGHAIGSPGARVESLGSSDRKDIPVEGGTRRNFRGQGVKKSGKAAVDHSLPTRCAQDLQGRGSFALARAALLEKSCYPWLFLLALAVLAVFLPVCGHDFLNFDDPINLSDNAALLRGAPADFLSFWQHPYANLYIPLTYSLWALVAKITAVTGEGGAVVLDPTVFHTLNLLTHLANVFLVLLLFRRLLPNVQAVLVGALFFAIHPMQVESVAWISEFRGLLSVFCALLSANLYLRHLARLDAGRRTKAPYALAVVFFVLGMLAKPSVVVLPLLLGLIGLLLLDRPPRQLARDLLPWLLLTVPIIVVNRFAQQSTTLSFYPELWQRALIAGDALSFSLYKLLVPFRLNPDYGRTPEYVLAHGWVWVTGLLPWLLIPVLCLKAPRTAIFPVAFWGVALLPVLGFVSFDFQKISTVANRYSYLAMLGPAFGIAWLSARYAGKRLWGVVLLAILVLLAVRCSIRVRYWENDFTFNMRALKINPRSWLANNNLGFAYFSEGQPAAAIPFYQRAIKLRPQTLVGHTNLADAQVALGQHREALTSYRQALALSPRNPWLFQSLGDTYRKLHEHEQAVAAYRQALAGNPDNLYSYKGLGRALTSLKKYDEAERVLRQGLAIDPGFAPAYLALAKLYLRQSRFDAAEQSYAQARALGLQDASFEKKLAKKRNQPQPARAGESA